MVKNKNTLKRLNAIFLFASLAIVGCTFFTNSANAAESYRFEGTGFYAYKDKYVGTSYLSEGTAFYTYSNQEEGTLPVYRFYNSTNGDHFYTISEAEKSYLENNNLSYEYEEIAFYAYPRALSESLPVYKFSNLTNGDHFYTISEAEKSYVQNNLSSFYRYEGVAFYANNKNLLPDQLSPVFRFRNTTTGDHFYTISEDEATELNTLSQKISYPIFRFSNLVTGDHFYTISEKEKSYIQNNLSSFYRYEGVAFYAFSRLQENTSPVYRFSNLINGDHFYTISSAEKSSLENNGSSYRYEGVAFYAFPIPQESAYPVYRFSNLINGDHFYTISEIEKNYLQSSNLGPEISVGLWYYSASALSDSSFRIDANKPYNIKDNDGNVIAQIGGSTTTRVTYDDDGYLEVYDSISSTRVKASVSFDAADGDNSTLIFNAHRPDSDYDEYRGKMKVRYYRGADIYNGSSSTVTQIWVINTLPLEHYVWGDGETTGTGDLDHTKVMTTIFRTYGKWYLEYATKYLPYGFKIRSDAGSQIYRGYEWETAHPNIKVAAQATRAVVVMYDDEVALTPYSSWSDGRTRSFEERWGSDDYPWCQSVEDPYGEHPTLSTSALEAAGNHMVGLIANGSVILAADHDWSYTRILDYYYQDVTLDPVY